MKKEVRSSLPDIFTAILYMISGFIMRNHFVLMVKYVYYTCIATFMFAAARAAVSYIKNKKTSSVFESIINLAFALLLLIKPESIIFMLKFICAGFMALLALIHGIALVQIKKDNAGSAAGYFFLSIFEIITAVRLILSNETGIYYVNRILGLYFIIYALCIVLDIIVSLASFKNGKKNKIHILLPAVMYAFIPKRILRTINKFLKSDELPHDMLNMHHPDVPHDIEIFIHMADTLFGQVGHVDLCFDNYVLSYGNYDESSFRLKGILGDGVVEIIDRNKYIRFCIEEKNKHIVGFGIKLGDEEKMKLQMKLKDIFENLIPWEPPILKTSANMLSSAQYELDYASTLYKATNALFYKFKDGKYGKFKTYFGLSTNCAALMVEITSTIGVSMFDFSGILTPGTYYDYLNSEYRRKNSFVVSKMLYSFPSGNNSRDI